MDLELPLLLADFPQSVSALEGEGLCQVTDMLQISKEANISMISCCKLKGGVGVKEIMRSFTLICAR